MYFTWRSHRFTSNEYLTINLIEVRSMQSLHFNRVHMIRCSFHTHTHTLAHTHTHWNRIDQFTLLNVFGWCSGNECTLRVSRNAFKWSRHRRWWFGAMAAPSFISHKASNAEHPKNYDILNRRRFYGVTTLPSLWTVANALSQNRFEVEPKLESNQTLSGCRKCCPL